MPDYSTSFDRYRAYTIGQETLAAIVKVAGDFIEASPTIKFYLEDDHTVEDTNLAALVSDTMVGGRNIQRVSVEGRKTLFSPLVSRSISVNFEVELHRIASVRIAGERDRSLAARREIETILAGAEIWYAPAILSRSSLLLFQMSIFIPLFMAMAAGVYVVWLFGGEVTTTTVSGWTLIVGAAFATVYFSLKDLLFPKLTFNFGRSANRIQYARYWRNFFLTSIVVGILAKFAIDRLLK
jgi:hypothetical protein